MNNADMTSNEKLMIIGAGWEQIPLITAAKAKGLCCIGIGTSANHDEISELVDFYEEADVRDLVALKNIALKYQVKYFISDQCDYSNYAVIYLRSLWAGSAPEINDIQLTSNKGWMREQCRQEDIVQPRFMICRSYEQVLTAVDLLDLPLVVKPPDSRGSQGVSVVFQESDLLIAFQKALEISYSREVLVEAYIQGTHVTVDGCFLEKNKHKILAVASKKITSGANPVIEEVLYPAQISDESLEIIKTAEAKVIRALGLHRGLTHSEYILDDRNRCFLLETANRGGGVYTSNIIIPELTGVDTVALLLDEALGCDVVSVIREPAVTEIFLGFFSFAPGKVKEIEGVEKIQAKANVKACRLFVGPGTVIEKPTSGPSRHGFVICGGDDSKHAKDLFAECRRDIVVTYA